MDQINDVRERRRDPGHLLGLGGTRDVEARARRAEWLSPGSLFIPLDILNSWRDEVLGVIPRVISDDPAYFRSRLQSKRPNALAAICRISSTDMIVASETYQRACAADLGEMFALCSP
jgi:alanine dehydrogenase